MGGVTALLLLLFPLFSWRGLLEPLNAESHPVPAPTVVQESWPCTHLAGGQKSTHSRLWGLAGTGLSPGQPRVSAGS